MPRTPSIPPTPPIKKNLVIALSGASLRGGGESMLSCWFLPRDEAWAWVQARRPLFPQAAAQELVALALLPSDLHRMLACAMCGIDPAGPTAGLADLGACQTPRFEPFTETSAICLLSVVSLGGPRELRSRFSRARALIGGQIASAIPSARRFPDGFLNLHATPADAEASMVAHLDQRALTELLCAPASRPARSKGPKLRL